MPLSGRVVAAATFALFAASLHAGCKDDPAELLVRPYDAGADVEDAAVGEAGPDFDPTLGGPCSETAQCDDDVPCTYDSCDLAIGRCRHVPDDTQCDDGTYCNGREVCVPRRGCAPGPVVTCQDGDPCTVDTCVEATKGCERVPRDVDGDGDPDDHCVADRDCNDADPTVSSQRTEICDNGKDDDCDGQIDETPCSRPANDVCATALTVTAPGTFLLSTVATKKDYATSCSVPIPAAAMDVVVEIRVPGDPVGPAKDVRVVAATDSSGNDVAVALQTTCGDSGSEVACAAIEDVNEARAVARGVLPGASVFAVVTTEREGGVSLKVEIEDAQPKPANETCATAVPAPVDTPFTVSVVDPDKDVPSACEAETGELAYSFTLGAPRDVRIFASTLSGPGDPVVSLRDPGDASCATELRCRAGETPPVFARALPAGTYVFTVAGTTQLDASVLVKTYPPTTAPPSSSCATAPAITPNVRTTVDVASHEDSIKNGCVEGALAAAYALELDAPSDVLVVGRFVQGTVGRVSLNGPACTTEDLLACRAQTTPARVSRRNLPAGSYRVSVGNELGLPADVTAFVRPTVAPTPVPASDGCTGTQVVPATGGFFTGDTTGKAADFGSACDTPGTGLGGAPDQLLRLDLTARKRVVLDMTGSTYTTLLAIRQGAACPGIEMPDACWAGFANLGRSFLERVLDAGTYWIQVDGYNGDKGTWNLDVRVLDP